MRRSPSFLCVSSRFVPWVARLALVFAMGCGDDDPVSALDASADATADAAVDATIDAVPDGPAPDGDAAAPLPGLGDLAAGQWHELLPGGDTICSRGTEFAFYVYPGTTNEVAVNFIGGGACWNAATCSIAGALFSEDIEDVRNAYATGQVEGIADMADARNPIGTYTHVVVPYCTGDVHWGDNVVDYSPAVQINHKGAVNSRVVLGWIYDNIAAPDTVFTTGCSAGGYGSVPWAADLRENYPTAHHVQFSDSAAGIITDSFFMDSFPSWNAIPAFPTNIPGFDATNVMDLATIYTALAGFYPDMRFSQYNTVLDGVQVSFYEAMGGAGGAEGWSDRMTTSVDSIAGDNFHSYLADGTQHCIIIRPEFYSRSSNGVALVDWIEDLLADQPVPDVVCENCE
ncbi:MAG: pectin acetylesterase-family hydrolase [Myxococcota bacterium]